MKAMHGSRNVLISGNQFIRNDLWAIGLMPGTSAHPGRDSALPNADGGTVVIGNVISDFGYGHAHWVWGSGSAPLRFERGQEPDDPPLRDVAVVGNVVHVADGTEARFRWAVLLDPSPGGPKGLRFTGNVLARGSEGISNVPLLGQAD